MDILGKINKILGRGPYSREQLIEFGARIGKNFYNGATIDRGHIHLLTIGDDVTLSACRILLHDASTKKHFGYARVGRVEIGSNVFVGAETIILPNVKIGSNVIIGSGSVVVKDIPDNCVAVGNPCRPVKTYQEFIRENEELFKYAPVSDIYSSMKTEKDRTEQYEQLKNGGIGFDL